MLSILINKQSIITEKMNTDNSSIENNTNSSGEYNNGSFDIEKDQYIETPWTIIGSYFKDKHLLRLVRHQIESYNNFVGYQIIKTIEMFNPVHIASEHDFDPVSKKYALEIFITFENFHIYRPQIHENNGAIKLMFPQEARLRNFTYASAMTIDINIKYLIRTGKGLENIQTFYKTLSKIHIGKLPIMLKSNICVLNQYKHFENTQTGECKYDAGGYFIINGSEKTVLGQERAAENRVYCFNVSKNNTKYTWSAEIKSVPDFKCISPKQINMMINSKNNGFGNPICIQIPRVKQPLPLFIVFRALGVLTDKDICNKILLNIDDTQNAKMLNSLQASIIEANAYLTKEECIKYIISFVMYTPINMDKDTGAKKKYEFTMDILNNDLFPHCHNLTQKIYFLGYMTHRLLLASFEITKQDDRDSYVNKRVDLTGTLLNNLFRNYFNKLVKDMEKQIVREINTGSWKSTDNYENIINLTNIYKIIKSTTIENGLKRALATGDFGIKHTNSNKVGVAQVLNRLTYVSSLSHARRISTPTDKSGKLIPPRKLHNTSWGFACLTGDVDVLLSNRIDTKKIKNIKDGDWVNSVNRENLMDEPSDMYNYFCKMPDNLFEITTISGRKIKATIDHPFLVRTDNGKYEMKQVGVLKTGDKLIIRHTTISIPDENTTIVKISEADVLEHYRMSLLELNLLNVDIPTYKLKIIARLIGALNTDGHLGVRNDENNQYYDAAFNVGEEYDVYQLADDIKTLGFGNVSIRRKITKFEDKNNGRTTTATTWEVSKSGYFAYFIYLMGGFSGKKINVKRSLPEWLINAELSVKREFLSAFQGGDGSRLSYQKNGEKSKPNLGITIQTTHNDYLNDTIEYINQIITLFKEFDIDCRLKTTKVNEEKTKVCIVFNKNTENLIRYADIISYSYCEEKRRTSAPIIEHLKIRGHNKIRRDMNYKYIVDNYKTEQMDNLMKKTDLSESQIKKVISKHKRGIYQSTRFTTDIIYETFIRENIVDNGCLSIPIESIKEIEPELVYDFTTRSENHSFVASSFVLSNCPAETPEGQSVGIVKNLSYMTHVTIHSNSLPLYEYVMPYILSIDSENITSKDMYEKVKVFINGSWVGITDSPQELFMMLKDKKYKGIINIYTSIVFDYRMKEIRVCNDSGRLTRPVLRVKDNNILLTNDIIHKLNTYELNWDDLLTSSVIDESVLEYIDPEEQSWSMIATVPKDLINKKEQIYKFTHCEIHPSTIFGILASCIPFPEHNQSPRNTYQCLDINETVLLSNGLKIPIKDIKVGDEVVSFNPLKPNELTNTKVVDHFIILNCNPVFEIVLTSGKKIIATSDHKFMTNIAWCETIHLIKKNACIAFLENKQIIYEKVSCVNRVSDRLVADITVESENHSFVTTHGILSSNCAQGKQAMGVYVTNYENRMDKTAYVLNYPTRPLVDTRIMNMIQLNKIPSGTNVIVAIMTHTGYNQEDSLLINKGSIDRGLALVTVYHTEKDEDKQKINGDDEIRCKPDATKTKGMKMGNYNKVNSKGVIPENTLVENRDVIIAKVTPIKENRNDPTKVIKFEDQSKIYKTNEETYIDKNYIDRNGEGYNFAKVRLRTVRKPVIGDKFCALPTQQVLTDKGWVQIRDIDITYHKVCTLDVNGNMTYEYPSAKFEYDHNDKMYYIKNKQVEIVCTLNHKLYVKTRSGKDYKLIEAQDVMGKMVRFQKTMTNVYPDIEFMELGDEKYKMDDWLQLLGMFIADGYLHNNIIYITAIKERKQEFMTSILNNLNLQFTYTAEGKYILSHSKNKQICENLSILSVGALNKYLPEYVFNLSERQSKILLEALIQGDGSKMEYKGETFDRYGTISIQLANDISRLALHCGYSGIVKLAEEPTGIARVGKRNLGSRAGQVVSITQQHTYYRVSIIKKQNQPWINKKVNDSNEEKLVDYEGKVYCIEMPSSHTYYMREHEYSPSLIIGNSSRHGQKGTIGNIIPECDMPFTRDGVKPDIIINPHAIPSRMTIGQLKETLLGKVLLQLGLFGDGTSFGQFDINDICKELLNIGYEAHGNELLCNGLTGEQHECSVFMGPVFYQRLKHMVNDKAHSRSIGPMVNLTRQPAEGRSRDGGLRFGEMERDCEYENTEIVMTNGLSIYIKNMSDCKNEVLGWDEKTNKLIPSKQSGFMYKGERECVKLTFEDGRTNICTPEHPILTSDNQWIKAKDLLVNQQKVKAGITCPVIDFDEEIKECNGWHLRVGDLLFKTDTKENYIKTLVLAKLIGYLVTDGNITKCKGHYKSIVFLGHMIDVNSFLSDLKLLCKTKQTNFISKNLYSVRIPAELTKNIVELDGILIGKKICQPAQLPEFILDEDCPLPIVREFLGGMFGGDGHTCVLGMHRGKRDILSSVSFSQTKNKSHLESLTQMFENIQLLLARFGIVNTTIQKFKETSYSKGKNHIEENNKNYQLTLHLDMNELIPFHDRIGFRYCCHKSQRLEAAVSYKRLRNEVTRQHNWLINRVDEITNFSKIKKEFPNKVIPTKNAITQAIEELKNNEPLIHEYAIPTSHDMIDHLIKGTIFGKFTSKSFPNAEEYLKEIGALEWFLEKSDMDTKVDIDMENIMEDDDEEEDIIEETTNSNIHSYGVNRKCDGLPTMELKVIDIRPAGIRKVYDIQVDNTHSFLANGVVAHNCMVSHGASRFTRERMYDVSDKYSVFICNKCGLIASYNDKMHIHHCRTCDNRTDFSYVQIPYSCKLLFQELNTMNIAPRIMTDHK
jgi:DNA-directed RNA polymerase beta subunit/intein/homing endonuclease